jgi:hypothetical protein
MPNGKKLSDCTGTDVVGFARFFSAVANEMAAKATDDRQ